MSTILDQIVANKRLEIEVAQDRVPVAELERRLAGAPPVRDFRVVLEAAAGVAIIAEVKRASPSAGLLLAEVLEGEELHRLLRQAQELGLQALVELYDADNLPRVLDSGARLIGVNNRDLRTFVTRLEHTLELAERLPAGCCLVSESGIRTRQAVPRLQAAGVRALLIG